MQADLQDIAGSLPNHSNKANVVIRRATWIFWFSSVYKLYLHYTVVYEVCNSIVLKKDNILNKNYFIAKKF